METLLGVTMASKSSQGPTISRKEIQTLLARQASREAGYAGILRVRRKQDELRQKVLRSVYALSTEAAAVKVADVAKLVKKDPRTVRNQLRFVAAKHQGIFLDKEESVFALTQVLDEVVKQKRHQAEKETMVEDMASQAAGLIWKD